MTLICLGKAIWQRAYEPPNIVLPFADDEYHGGIVVEIAGETNRRGIYFLTERKRTLHDLTVATGMSLKGDVDKEWLYRILERGDRIVLCRDEPYVMMERMDSRTLLALNLPVDINRVSMEDLTLIPGIGLKIAKEIIALREKSGGFSKKNDLQLISGLGKKKYDDIKGHIFIGKNK